MMNNLPNELVDLILNFHLQSCRGYKNQVLQLRLVSKKWDVFLRPYVFKTIQLELSKFLSDENDDDAPRIESIKDVGKLCRALYCDMMVIRDNEEIEHLLAVFSTVMLNVPEMKPLIESLRQFCMQKETFDENDFKRVMGDVLRSTPHLTRLKLNLPFQVIGKASRTATLLLARTFESLASREPDHTPLEVLVLDHVSDSTIYNICNNPRDLGNARRSFEGLKSLVLSIKRQEKDLVKQARFTYFLWHLVGHAAGLESLCLIGWNTKRSSDNRVETLDTNTQGDEWFMKSLPYPAAPVPTKGLKHLRCLELKRVDIDPITFVRMIDENSDSLKELYLNEVHLKIRGPADRNSMCLWIGHGPEQARPSNVIWIAEYLREKESLDLDIIRATSLGYDDYSALDANFFVQAPNPVERYDLDDPSGNSRSFDLRFVETAMGVAKPTKNPPSNLSDPELMDYTQEPTPSMPKHFYEVEAYQRTPYPYSEFLNPESSHDTILTQVQSERQNSCQGFTRSESKKDNNTTSHFKRSIDGIFYNHNERALAELQKIIGVVDTAMNLLSAEIDRIGREAGEARRA